MKHTIKEVIDNKLLPFRRTKLHDLIREGQLGHCKEGRNIFIDDKHIADFWAKREVKAKGAK